MKSLSRAIILLTAVCVLSFSLQAEVIVEPVPVSTEQGEFYFPDYDQSVEDFWEEVGILLHTCSATSWLGHVASASCEDNKMCECITRLLWATCACKSPASAPTSLSISR